MGSANSHFNTAQANQTGTAGHAASFSYALLLEDVDP